MKRDARLSPDLLFPRRRAFRVHIRMPILLPAALMCALLQPAVSSAAEQIVCRTAGSVQTCRRCGGLFGERSQISQPSGLNELKLILSRPARGSLLKALTENARETAKHKAFSNKTSFLPVSCSLLRAAPRLCILSRELPVASGRFGAVIAAIVIVGSRPMTITVSKIDATGPSAQRLNTMADVIATGVVALILLAILALMVWLLRNIIRRGTQRDVPG